MTRLVAHRGLPREHRENTLASVRAAGRAGAWLVEIDLRCTADGVAVALHDATLERVWGDPRAVADLPVRDVVRIGDDERIPRLDEILEVAAAEGIGLLLDMTGAADARAGVAAVRSARRRPRLVWCGTVEAMTVVRDALPDAEIWLEWRALDAPGAADLADLRPSAVNLDVAFLTPQLVVGAHARGLEVAVWTVDTPDLARWAASLGVDSITTNDLPALAAALATPWVPDAARDVAEDAERTALRIAEEVVAFTRAHPIEDLAAKADPADLVTDVDRLVEQFVRGRIREAFPGHGFSGEEYGDAPGDEYRWYLDPVDGTTNLVNGIPWTSMSLCMVRRDVPLVGVVADPWRDEVLVARRGRGARAADRMLRLDPADAVALAGGAVGTELAGHRPWSGLGAFLDGLAARSCALRIMGSGTLALAQVAAGRGVGACVSAFDPIDHGAAILLVLEAGGAVLTPSGPVDGFPERGAPVLVAHPAVADELAELWRSALQAEHATVLAG